MEIYVTTASMISHDDVKKLFATRTRKECSLYIYCENDSKLAISDVKELLDASKKINIEFFEIASQNDFVFSIGLLVGKLGAKSQIYTILPETYELSDAVQEQYGLKKYIASASPTPRARSQKKSKSTDSIELTPQKTNDDSALPTEFDEPLFFSEDSRKFFYDQLNLLPEEIESNKTKDEIGHLVAECMKAANDDEQLLRFQLEQNFGEYADVIMKHITQRQDLLMDCLFIKR